MQQPMAVPSDGTGRRLGVARSHPLALSCQQRSSAERNVRREASSGRTVATTTKPETLVNQV